MPNKDLQEFQANIDDDHDIVRWLLDNNYKHLLDPAWIRDEPPHVVQIKGSGKKDINQDLTPEDYEKYSPYVANFLSEQNWPITRDFKNAGLMDLKEARTFNPEAHPEFLKFLDEKLGAGQLYHPKKELQELYEQYHGPDAGPVYAKGGLIKPQDRMEDLNLFLGLE